MATVPSTVDNVREQIKEAIKLSLLASGPVVTVLPLATDWGAYTASTSYPLAKVFAGKSELAGEYMGKRDRMRDQVTVVIAPYCTDADWELAVSKMITGAIAAFDTEAVRSYMDPTYSPSLYKVQRVLSEPVETSLANPRGAVQITLQVEYSVSW